MTRHRSTAEIVARFYVGRIRNRLTAWRPTRRKEITLTGRTPSGQTVRLRLPRFTDAPAWRRIRLHDRAVIEPVWVSSGSSWAERHTDAVWIRECLHGRADTTAGRALPLVIEVDGHLAGQCNLEWIDAHNRTAELGFWVDSARGGTGIGSTAAAIALKYGFTELGLQRISAPINVTNMAAARLVARIGLTHEGTMSSYLDVGGHRADHDLWAITADRFARISSST